MLAGLDGLRKKIEPPEPIDYDLYSLSPSELAKVPSLPSTLEEAVELMESDSFAREALGSEIYDTFVDMKKREIEEYRLAITDWELNKYGEI